MGWFSSCDHDWEKDWEKSRAFKPEYHKCKKCGKTEKCTFNLCRQRGPDNEPICDKCDK